MDDLYVFRLMISLQEYFKDIQEFSLIQRNDSYILTFRMSEESLTISIRENKKVPPHVHINLLENTLKYHTIFWPENSITLNDKDIKKDNLYLMIANDRKITNKDILGFMFYNQEVLDLIKETFSKNMFKGLNLNV